MVYYKKCDPQSDKKKKQLGNDDLWGIRGLTRYAKMPYNVGSKRGKFG